MSLFGVVHFPQSLAPQGFPACGCFLKTSNQKGSINKKKEILLTQKNRPQNPSQFATAMCN
jgi:hypothetical protein